MFRRCTFQLAKDPFKVLGLTRTATKAQVKAKYRELAKQHHPDAEHGSSVKMEEINRAYNLLLKEGAYERLHLSGSPRPSAGAPAADGVTYASMGRKPSAPFAKSENVNAESEDYSKVSALNVETERVTPEGKFMYQNRDTNEWVTLDRPLVRANQPRYRSFATSSEATAAMQEELRRRRDEQERLQNSKSAFQRAADQLRDSSHLPSNSKWFLYIAAGFVVLTAYVVYQKTIARRVFLKWKAAFYRQIDEDRLRREHMYADHKIDIETLVAAAALVMAAAAIKKSVDDPLVPPRGEEHYNRIKPPSRHFEIVNANYFFLVVLSSSGFVHCWLMHHIFCDY